MCLSPKCDSVVLDHEEEVTGTIYDEGLPDIFSDPVRHQRSCGLFYLHDVNPAAVVAGSVNVSPATPTDSRERRVMVSYMAVVPAEGETQWGDKLNDRMPLPLGLICEHGDSPHKVVERRSFTASWTEVAR